MSEVIEKYTVTTNGTSYIKETAKGVVQALELAREKRMRIRVWYGDVITGKSWLEEFDVTGYVGRSTGVKRPILVHNERSFGGGALLDDCVIRIDSTTGYTLYKHPKFFVPAMSIVEREEDNPYKYEVHIDKGNQAAFSTHKKAQKYIDFMNGKRYSK